MRKGKYVLEFETKPSIIAWSSVVGKKENEGPLGGGFDLVIDDPMAGRDTWEEAESEFQKTSVGILLDKARLCVNDIDVIYAGDLLNQCSGSAFGIKGYDIPFVGIYGACSTSVLAMINAAVGVESGLVNRGISSTSSHFCSAEKQFRFPLEYGGQRTPTAQWTVTGAASALVSSKSEKNCPKIERAIIGRIVDKGVTDVNNMGAAMAPAAAQTICNFLSDTNTSPEDYDLIMTGDLGEVGSQLLCELTQKEYGIDISKKHKDAGMMIYYGDEQDVHAGGSGCACCGTVLCSKILNGLKNGELNRVLVVATGALLSTVSPFQGESIPSIAHGIMITSGKGTENE